MGRGDFDILWPDPGLDPAICNVQTGQIPARLRCGSLIHQIAFQGKDLEGGELVGPADDIQGVGHSVHHIDRGGIHHHDAGVVALYIAIAHDDGAITGAGQGFRDRGVVGSLVNGAVSGDIQLAQILEDPPVSRQEDIHSPAVGGQVHRPETAGVAVITGAVGEGEERDARAVINDGHGVSRSVGKINIPPVQRAAGLGIHDGDQSILAAAVQVVGGKIAELHVIDHSAVP